MSVPRGLGQSPRSAMMRRAGIALVVLICVIAFYSEHRRSSGR